MTDTIPQARPTRQSVAARWFSVLLMLTGALAGAGLAFGGNLFGTSDQFNLLMGIGTAACVVIIWLPVVALFDYLRHDRT